MADNQSTATVEKQLVVFRLAEEAYGVDIGTVREIIRRQEITQVPNTPEYVEGVINLRGKVCPVIDLRKCFDVTVGEVTSESRIVVVEVNGEDVGVIVDAVNEVLRIPSDCIAPSSAVVANGDSSAVEGIVNLGERLIILVELETLLGTEANGALKQVQAKAA